MEYNSLLSSPKTLSEIHAISDQNLIVAENILNLIEKKSVNAAVKLIKKFELKELLAICACEKFKLIKEFCETNSILTERWVKSLKKYGYPEFEIISVDNTGKTTPFSMLLGAYYYGKYLEWAKKYAEQKTGLLNSGEFLKLACECGVIYAWKDKLKHEADFLLVICQKQIEQNKAYFGLADLTYAANQMLQTSSDMGNKFSSSGFFSSAVILERTAIELAIHPGQKILLERIEMSGKLPLLIEDYPVCLKLMIGAISSYYHAWLLFENPESKKLVDSILPDGIFKDNSVSSWNDLQGRILQELKVRFKVPLPESFAETILEQVKNKLNNSINFEEKPTEYTARSSI